MKLHVSHHNTINHKPTKFNTRTLVDEILAKIPLYISRRTTLAFQYRKGFEPISVESRTKNLQDFPLPRIGTEFSAKIKADFEGIS